MRGRLGSGILERLSLPTLVADDPRSYADRVVALAQNRGALSRVREQLRMNLPGIYRDRVYHRCAGGIPLRAGLAVLV